MLAIAPHGPGVRDLAAWFALAQVVIRWDPIEMFLPVASLRIMPSEVYGLVLLSVAAGLWLTRRRPLAWGGRLAAALATATFGVLAFEAWRLSAIVTTLYVLLAASMFSDAVEVRPDAC